MATQCFSTPAFLAKYLLSCLSEQFFFNLHAVVPFPSSFADFCSSLMSYFNCRPRHAHILQPKLSLSYSINLLMCTAHAMLNCFTNFERRRKCLMPTATHALMYTRLRMRAGTTLFIYVHVFVVSQFVSSSLRLFFAAIQYKNFLKHMLLLQQQKQPCIPTVALTLEALIFSFTFLICTFRGLVVKLLPVMHTHMCTSAQHSSVSVNPIQSHTNTRA